METQKAVLIGAGVGALGVSGWVAFRYYVRSETKKTLVTEYSFDKALDNIAKYEAVAGLDFNVPSLDEFVDALVPIWSTKHPKDAIDDIFVNGRRSAYWPAAYRRSVAPKQERMFFAALKGAKDAPEGASTVETLLGVGINILKTLQ
jgi:FAD/FMN-containing dehydrogenase